MWREVREMENVLLNLLEEKITIINEKFNNEALNEEEAEIVKFVCDAIEIFRREQKIICLFPKFKNSSLGIIDEEALHDILNKDCQEILQEIAIKKLGHEAKSKVALFKGKILIHSLLKKTIQILFNSDLDKVSIFDLPLLKKIILNKVNEVPNGKY